jgi:hypothetical protein
MLKVMLLLPGELNPRPLTPDNIQRICRRMNEELVDARASLDRANRAVGAITVLLEKLESLESAPEG